MAEKIKSIEIKGKKYSVWGGYYALEKFELITGLGADKVTSNVTCSVTFTWCSMWAGAKMQEEEFEVSLDDFKAMVNEDMSILTQAKEEEADSKKPKLAVASQPED
ncbi:MAG: hypothetical protein JKY55_01030 [Aliivibrio sp.]|uniref:hypothetical protein n=1 Tax=Aliivibrio sp. TaxID=1872443 RepID=UPI001A52202E|nr:hypothetical protein [Aliivibrio sp.]